MGIGEPLDNFDNLIKSISILTSPYGLYLSPRRICVSTCGIVPGIKQLLSAAPAVKLSISLHSAVNRKRSLLMPVNEKYPLTELIEAAKQYAKESRFPVTFEYILIKDFNCSTEDARQLARLLKGIDCKLNIILYNPSEYFKWQAPTTFDVDSFTDILRRQKIFFTLRQARGQDIMAACGQLRVQSS